LKRVLTKELKPGMVVARDVPDGKGGFLLRRGVPLSAAYIRALQERDYAWVFISDDASDSLVVEDMVSSYLASSSLPLLRSLRRLLAANSQPGTPAGSGQAATEDTAVEQEAEQVSCVVGQVLSANAVTAMARMASNDQTLLYHGLDTATVAVSFGMRLGLDEASLRSLALGCLLHDCGKTLLREHILVLPLLSEEQLAELRRHPLLGLQVLRELGLDDLQVASIVAQHHERQDGLGYPRGSRGTNHISSAQQSGRIALAAEVASICDTYAVLTSDTLAGGRLEDHLVLRSLQRMSGTVLNRQLLSHFLNPRPLIPVGMFAYVQSGKNAGYRGLTVRRSSRAEGQVVVRLTQDGSGAWVQPFEVDLGEEPEVQVKVAFE